MKEINQVGLPLHAPEPISTPLTLHRLPELFNKSRGYVATQWTRDHLLAVQQERLRRLLIHSLKSVPRYRDLEVTVEEVNSDPYAALRAFPYVEKRDLQTKLTDFVSDQIDANCAFKVTTSGSTGIPLVIVDDHDSLIEYAASYSRIMDAYGLNIGARLAHIIADAARPTRMLEAQLLLSASELCTENLLSPDSRLRDEAIEFLREWKPSALLGNPSDIVLLAIRLRELGHILPTVKAIFSCGENLTASMRNTIESVMGIGVAEIYSMQECKAIAWACQDGSLHINEDRVLVEAIPHHSGNCELVITHLCNLSMPLIRYKTSDLGSPTDFGVGSCSCGRSLNTIVGFLGRDRGFLVTPDGRLFSPRAIKQFLTALPLVTWRLVQEIPNELHLAIVPELGESAEDLCRVIQIYLQDFADGQIEVSVKAVNLAQLSAQPGKFQMMRLAAYQSL